MLQLLRRCPSVKHKKKISSRITEIFEKKGHQAAGHIFIQTVITKHFFKKKGRDAKNHICLQFLAGNKNAILPKSKLPNTKKISAKIPQKISYFFVLIGNTKVACVLVHAHVHYFVWKTQLLDSA